MLSAASANGMSPAECEAIAAQELNGLELALAVATDLTQVKHLNDRAAVVKDMLRRMGVAFDTQNRFAEIEMRCERKLGEMLPDIVHDGRPRKRSHAATVSEEAGAHTLPKWINKSKSSRCQRLATIPASTFEQFFVDAKARRRRITRAWLLRTCLGPTTPRSRKRNVQNHADAAALAARGSSAWTENEDLDAVWDAVQATMDVSIVVGVRADLVEAGIELSAADGLVTELAGNIVVLAEDNVDAWLSKLTEAVRERSVKHAIVVFRMAARERWFRQIDEHGWSCCLMEGTTVVAFLGDHYRAFGLAFRKLGAVVRGLGVQEGDRVPQ